MISPDLSLGGAEKVFVRLANAFVERGRRVDVVLVCARGHHREELDERCRCFDLSRGRVAAALPPLLRYLGERRPASVLSIHTHLNVLATLAVGMTAVSTRVVLAEHALLHSVYSATSLAKERWTIRGTRLAYPRADAIVAVSDAAARDVSLFSGVRRNAIEVIPNPVVSQVGETEGGSVHPWLTDGGEPVVVSLGRLEAEKSLDRLIQAVRLARAVRPMRLLILGEGSLRGQLEDLVREVGLGDAVALPGMVTNPLAHLEKAELLASASRYESFGNVLVEALSVGTPVVAVDVGGPAEVLGGGTWGTLVPVAEPRALADGILYGLDHPQPPEQLQARAQAFSDENVVPRYLDLLER